jgi:iron uptake system component EfeO
MAQRDFRATLVCLVALVALQGFACTPTPAQFQANAESDVKNRVTDQLAALHQAGVDLRDATPTGGGWSAADRSSIDRMKVAWQRTRVAYESIEGAIAVLFPDIDHTIDDRYNNFLAQDGPDTDLFDGRGVTGMHAIERVLWSDQLPAGVVAYESRLDGYVAARFPQTQAEAQEFHDGLAQRLVTDIESMQQQFAPLALDDAAAFRGVIGSLHEQIEKIDLASSSEDESRYAQNTLADMRANLQGGLDTFELFRSWLLSVKGSDALARQIEARFAAIKAAYDAIPGSALPPEPAGYNPDMPSASDATTPYGQLRALLATEADPMRDGSIVNSMDQAADAMGIHQLAGM